MTVVPIDARRITDPDTLHDVFAEAFGFPDFYGRNMNAWIDAMSSLAEPAGVLATVHVPDGGVCVVRLTHAADFPDRCPDLLADLAEAAAFVNWRVLEAGWGAVVALAFYD